MILSDKKILEEIEKGTIVIKPFDVKNMGGNSYDVHLSKYFAKYKNKTLDAKKHNKVKHFEIPKQGYVLKPKELYLCTTMEYTETHKHVPFLEGKVDRLYNKKATAKYGNTEKLPKESMMWKNKF